MKCPRCNFENPAGAKFCSECGVKLIEIYRAESREQRRRVAIRFADISGFTSLSERLDPEEMKTLINKCLKKLADVIYQYEGYVDKFIGDCIMALFGAPVVHEDDPLRAVLSAIDLLEEIKRFNRKNNQDLSLSIGINYGMVATGDIGRPGEYTVMGDTVNLAQRLQYSAHQNEIYVSKSVYENTKDEIDYEKLKKLKVKGKREMVEIFRPKKILRAYSLRKIEELPLIGREAELRKLLKFFTETRINKGKAVSIIGEAGIGKSKLVYEFKKQLSFNRYLIEAKGIEYLKTSSYFILREILKNLFRITEADSRNNALQKLNTFIKNLNGSSGKKIVPFLKYFLGFKLDKGDYNRFESMKPDDRIRMINEAILQLLLDCSQIKSLIIILDDCHWIDRESLNFVERLAEKIADKSIMLITLYRPEMKIARISKLSYHQKINLRPLSSVHCITLVREMLNCEKIEDKLDNLLIKKSGGIPFNTKELTTNLINNNIVVMDGKNAKLKTGMEMVVPRTLDELIMAKVDKLDERRRTIVDIASVIGDEFSFKLLNTLLELGEILKNDLVILEQKGIIQQARIIENSLPQKEKYTFKHSLTREAIYQSLLKQIRKDYHRQIGYAIEMVYTNNISEHLDALAHHFLLGEERKKALEYLEKAGDYKRKFYLNDDAIMMYNKCLELIKPSENIKIIKIYEKLGGIYELTGRYDEAINAYEQMKKYGRADKIVSAKSTIAIANVKMTQSKYDNALNLLTEAKKLLKESREDVELANILNMECYIYRIKGKMREAEQKGLKVISKITSLKGWQDCENLKKCLARAYYYIAVVYCVKGEYAEARKLCKDMLLISEQLGDRHHIVGRVYNILGTIHRDRGEYNQAIELYKKKLKICEELGDKAGIATVYANLGNVYQNKGDDETAIELFEKYLKISRELNFKHWVGTAYNNLGIVYEKRGEYTRAIELFKKYLSVNKELDDKRAIAIAHTNLGYVCQRLGEYQRAIRLFKKCLKMTEELGDKRGIGFATLNLGTIYTETNKFKLAQEYLVKAEKIFLEIGNKLILSNIYNTFASLRLKQSRIEDSLNFTKKALLLSGEVNDKENLGLASMNLGKIYRVKSDEIKTRHERQYFKKSSDSFKKAIHLFEEIKNSALMAEAYSEYAKLSGNSREAREYLHKALEIYKKLNLKHKLKELTK